jgi:hypothetical protein
MTSCDSALAAKRDNDEIAGLDYGGSFSLQESTWAVASVARIGRNAFLK